MKKLISLAAAAGMFLCSLPLYTAAAEKAVPAEIDKYIYDQFMDISWKYDLTGDGILNAYDLCLMRRMLTE